MQTVYIGCISGAVVLAVSIGYFIIRSLNMRANGERIKTSDKDAEKFAKLFFGVHSTELTRQQRRDLAASLIERERSTLLPQAALTSVLLAVSAGLIASYSVSRSSLLTEPEAPSEVLMKTNATVDVVVNGDIHQVAADGLTLLRAITTASTTGTLQDDEESPLLVSLRRQDGATSHVYYMPLSMVLNGVAGETALQPDDIARVVSYDETSLGVQQSTEAGVSFEVSGRVEKPGDFKTIEVSESIMNVTTEEYAGGFEIDGVRAEVIIVSRKSPGGSPQEHFFVPITDPYLNLALLESRLYDGDRLEYVLLQDVALFRRSD